MSVLRRLLGRERAQHAPTVRTDLRTAGTFSCALCTTVCRDCRS